MPAALVQNGGNQPKASRRELLSSLVVVPLASHTAANHLSKGKLVGDRPLPTLERTPQGRQLSRSRYHNAECFFRLRHSSSRAVDADDLYSSGIVIQLGLSAHLLDVGFDDQWCALNIGLHVSRSLAFANATGFHFDAPDFELLAALLSPYGKWRHGLNFSEADFPFTAGEIGTLVRLLLDRVHAITGHPRPRGWQSWHNTAQ